MDRNFQKKKKKTCAVILFMFKLAFLEEEKALVGVKDTFNKI